MAGKSKSAVYYQNNKSARDKKKKYDSELNKRPEQARKRSELITRNREADKRGVDRTNKDWDHGSRRYVSSSTNRGKTSGTVGDRNARGKKKKK